MSNAIGDIGESRFITEALRHGLMPCVPFSGASRFDVAVFTPAGKSYKVQVKTTKGLNSSLKRYEFGSASKKKKSYSHKDVDLFAFYVIDTDDFYLVPFHLMEGKRRLNISPNGEKYKEMKNRFDLL